MTTPPLDDQLSLPIDGLTYEQAFAQLESIVGRLESDEHALDLALALFERGQALARYCEALLDQAELRVQQLTADGLTDYPG
jgi:exodeoxyribonuclease VII small subunit